MASDKPVRPGARASARGAHRRRGRQRRRWRRRRRQRDGEADGASGSDSGSGSAPRGDELPFGAHQHHPDEIRRLDSCRSDRSAAGTSWRRCSTW
jgi:hypothetical protein